MKPSRTFSEKKTVIFASKEGSLIIIISPSTLLNWICLLPCTPQFGKKKVFPLFLDIIQVLCNIYVLIVVVPCSSGIDLTYFLNNEINQQDVLQKNLLGLFAVVYFRAVHFKFGLFMSPDPLHLHGVIMLGTPFFVSTCSMHEQHVHAVHAAWMSIDLH